MATRSRYPGIFDGPYDAENTRILSYKHPKREKNKDVQKSKQLVQKVYLSTEKRTEKNKKTEPKVQPRRSARLIAKREEMAKLEKRQ
jgi:hypothetical protein